MLFNSPLYGVFLVSTFVVYWLLRKHRIARLLFLVLASYGFYFYGTYDSAQTQPVPLGPLGWSLLCLGIIFLGSTLDYAIGQALGRTEHPLHRKLLLLASVVYYLGFLSIFKYFNFVIDAWVSLAASVGLHVRPIHLRLILPFGISFFTFETMSYTIDVYRRELKPATRYLDYLLFVCFFPHLVAGPIVRPHTMLPQFEGEPIVDEAGRSRGLWLIAGGLIKKVIIGDTLAVNLVNRVFDNPERFSSIEVLFAIYGYAIEIYSDFSGYTDVAIGSALLFGFQLPKNFDRPYLAHNLQDFWRRWHISLSTWLRDYLYVPLGGSRGRAWLTYRNLMITMVLGGLWHGASWNFVVWGALHGAALVATRMWQRSRIGPWGGNKLRPLLIILTFNYVCVCWVFFRAPSLAHVGVMFERLADGVRGTDNLGLKAMSALALGVVFHLIPKAWVERAGALFGRSPATVQGIVLAAAAYAIHFASGAKAEPFVYGQF